MMGQFCSKKNDVVDDAPKDAAVQACNSQIESKTGSSEAVPSEEEDNGVDEEEDRIANEKYYEDNGPADFEYDAKETDIYIEDEEDSSADEMYYDYDAGSVIKYVEEAGEDEDDSDVDDVNANTQDDLIGAGWELWHEVTLIQIAVAEAHPTLNDSLMACEAHLMSVHAAAFKLHHKDFKAAGKPSHVDIGYHFTKSENIRSIDRDGLLSLPDRKKQKVQEAKYSGSSMGEGIYTCSDTSYAGSGQYGATGLMVARLRGVENTEHMCNSRETHYDHHDTCVNGNVVVLHNSAQCMVLMQFDRELMDSPEGITAVQKAHELLQKLMDRMFNGTDTRK